MSESNQADGLSCDGLLSLSWSVLGENADHVSEQLLQANLSRLRTIQGLDEFGRDLSDEYADLAQELQRIDFKVNVILEMVSQLAAQSINLPEPVAVKLRADSITWQLQAAAPDAGQRLQLELFLDKRFPFPLLLQGKVIDVEQGWACLDFDTMDSSFQDIFEKFVFRCHRREIARLKRDGER